MTTPPTAPTPESAYAEAPCILGEITWVFSSVAHREFGDPMGREYWLRKAAVLDRIALAEAERYAPQVAAQAIETAEKAAHRLADFDYTHHTTRGPLGPLVSPPGMSYRPYVRQEYLAWLTAHAES
ncbi:hypothetical protein [Streptomyces boncukensis]|uniref:Uncharacterized protein n=1 Tax=Streptomyces boncukensis TaxID=2711219 RepID=A0A6G4WRK5_9ACTN|nr:hypothetical protein [Streptomyces boncukensis]NGO67472.1 hypothetical protein [Streptomyces boncukensis]